MTSRCLNWFFAGFPALAVLCIAFGPSPAAAAARLSAEADREAQRKACQDGPGSKSTSPDPDTDRDSSSISSFVAPASAKPAEVSSTHSLLDAAVLFERPWAAFRWLPSSWNADRSIGLATHRRPHFPNAPPAC